MSSPPSSVLRTPTSASASASVAQRTSGRARKPIARLGSFVDVDEIKAHDEDPGGIVDLSETDGEGEGEGEGDDGEFKGHGAGGHADEEGEGGEEKGEGPGKGKRKSKASQPKTKRAKKEDSDSDKAKSKPKSATKAAKHRLPLPAPGPKASVGAKMGQGARGGVVMAFKQTVREEQGGLLKILVTAGRKDSTEGDEEDEGKENEGGKDKGDQMDVDDASNEGAATARPVKAASKSKKVGVVLDQAEGVTSSKPPAVSKKGSFKGLQPQKASGSAKSGQAGTSGAKGSRDGASKITVKKEEGLDDEDEGSKSLVDAESVHEDAGPDTDVRKDQESPGGLATSQESASFEDKTDGSPTPRLGSKHNPLAIKGKWSPSDHSSPSEHARTPGSDTVEKEECEQEGTDRED